MIYDERVTKAGQRLKELRKSRKISKDKLAKTMEITIQTLTNYENGNTELKIRYLEKACSFLGCTTDYIIVGSTDEKYKNWLMQVRLLPEETFDLLVGFTNLLLKTTVYDRM